MKHTENQGLRALMEVNNIEPEKLTAYHIGFVHRPLSECHGRLDTAVRALQLLEEKDRAEAVRIASDLKQLNDSRKEMTDISVKQAVRLVEEKRWERIGCWSFICPTAMKALRESLPEGCGKNTISPFLS